MKKIILLLVLFCSTGLMAQDESKKDRFADRTSTVSPDIASAKDNLPVKKETVAAKMSRITGDGNKIGVYFNPRPVSVNPNPSTMSSSVTEDVSIKGELTEESLASFGQEFTNELNAALGRTDIELIDMAKIPYRGTSLKIDDWWATKYKLVFEYTVQPQIRAVQRKAPGDKYVFAAWLKFESQVVLTEYVGEPTSNKKEIVTRMIDMGAFTAQELTQDEVINDIKILYEKVLAKLGVPLQEKAKAERSAGVKRLVEKKLTP